MAVCIHGMVWSDCSHLYCLSVRPRDVHTCNDKTAVASCVLCMVAIEL